MLIKEIARELEARLDGDGAIEIDRVVHPARAERPSDLALAMGGDAAAALAQTKARMDRLKRSPEPVAMKFLFELFGSGPKAIQDVATSIFGSKASLVMTNVVGPKEKVYLAGVPVDQMLFWVPHPGKELGVGISILSYRGMASLAVIADAGLVPDPEKITDEFNLEFGRMKRAAQRASAAADVGAPPRTRATKRTPPRRRKPARPAH